MDWIAEANVENFAVDQQFQTETGSIPWPYRTTAAKFGETMQRFCRRPPRSHQARTGARACWLLAAVARGLVPTPEDTDILIPSIPWVTRPPPRPPAGHTVWFRDQRKRKD